MDGLDRMLDALAPWGVALDLQVIRPTRGWRSAAGSSARSTAARSSSGRMRRLPPSTRGIVAGDLVEEAVDDHDVRSHYPSGRDVVEDVAESKQRLPESAIRALEALDEPVVVRERCRLRPLRLVRRTG